MNNLREIILLSFLILSCDDTPLCIDTMGEEKGNVFSCCCNKRITEDDVEDNSQSGVKPSHNNDLTAITEDEEIENLRKFIPADLFPSNPEPLKILKGKLDRNLNIFKVSEFIPCSLKDLNLNYYYITEENKYLLILSNVCGIRGCFSLVEKGDTLYPKSVFLKLNDDSFAQIDVSFDTDRLTVKYKNSIVVINNAETKTNPFILSECKVNIREINELAKNSWRAHCESGEYPKFLLYFYDCAAAIEGAKMTFLNENYFLNESDVSEVITFSSNKEDIKSKFQRYKEHLLSVQSYEHRLSFVKIPIDFSLSKWECFRVQTCKIFSQQKAEALEKMMHSLTHAILLGFYRDENRWFILDSNIFPNYYNQAVVEALSDLGIRLCDNVFFTQSSDTCDVCASVNSFYLSSYLNAKGQLDFTEDGNLDFNKIRNFVMLKKIEVPFFEYAPIGNMFISDK